MTEAKIYSDTFLGMGTPCDVVLPDVEADFAKQVFQLVKSEVQNLEELLDGSNPNSPLAVLRRAKINEWVKVPDELWPYLSVSYDLYQMSNGAFDVTVAPLVALWEQNENPSEREIQNVRERCGFDKIELDFEQQKIRFLHDGIWFDFGAIQKGFALDLLKPLLLELKVENAIISFGEDVVLALGNHPNGELWPLGIRNQHKPMEFVHVFGAHNQVLTSTGSFEKEGMADGVLRSFTISPETGCPISEKKTVSVKSESATMGGFLATCWLILPDNDKAILSENLNDIEILEVDYLEDDIKTRLSILSKEE